MTPPWLSVVSVVKDDSAGLQRTLQSLTNARTADVEMVVHDGSGPREREACAAVSSAVGVDYAWAAPRGVYPAMNEAWQRATGEYVLFLNAGDELASSDVLDRARAALASRPRWAFGRIAVISRAGDEVASPAWNYPAERQRLFARGLFPPHQATFMARALLSDLGGFDEHYSIAADYELALRASLVADPFVLDLVVARFHEGGVSTTGWRDALREFHCARRSVLQPRGYAAVMERLDTARAWAMSAVYRGVLQR